MKTVAVLAQKGGVGKTTLTVHLAVLAGQRGMPAAILDVDPQRSAHDWADQRENETPAVVSVEPGQITQAKTLARSDGTELLLIDTAPHAEAGIVAAARVADFVLVPCRPAVLDLRAIGSTLNILTSTRKDHAVVLNACPPQRGFGEPSLVTEAREYLASIEAPCLDATATQRMAFSHALIDGRAVSEFEPNGKAAGEISTLLDEILGRIG